MRGGSTRESSGFKCREEKKSRTSYYSFASSNGVSGNSFCCYCSDPNHSPLQCIKVTDIEGRKAILMKTRRCFVCLKRNHKAKECHLLMTCSNCRRKHHASICGASSKTKSMSPRTRQASCSESSSVNALSCHVLKVEASQHGCSNASLDQALRKFWDLETLGIIPEESSVYDDFMHMITFQNGRYCTVSVFHGRVITLHYPTITTCVRRGCLDSSHDYDKPLMSYGNMTRSSKTKSVKEFSVGGSMAYEHQQAALSTTPWHHSRGQVDHEAQGGL